MNTELTFIHPLSSSDELSKDFLKSFIKKFKQDDLKIYIFIIDSTEIDDISDKLASITKDKRYVVLSRNELLFNMPENIGLHVNKLIVLAISRYIRTKFYVLLTCKNKLVEKLTYNSIINDNKLACFSLFRTQIIQKYLKDKEYHHIDKEFEISFKSINSYRGFYINLKKDIKRNKSILKNLNDLDLNNYERFAAYDGEKLAKMYRSRINPGSLGSGFSHRGVLDKNIDSDYHLHIIEDDVILHKYLPKIFESIKDKMEWDIIYTDMYFSLLSPESFYMFHEKYKLYQEKGDFSVVNLKGINFSGASSYFVNKKSIKKIHSLLSIEWFKHSKHDAYINTLVQKGELNAFVIVPFVSTLSEHSRNSTIDKTYSTNMLAMDSLRKAFYINAPLKELSNSIKEETKVIKCSEIIDIYTNSTKIMLNNLDKKIDTKVISLS